MARVKQVFNTSEVPHIWAKQSQESGRNSQGNLYFEGKTIYSYGSHFAIARFLTDDIILFTDRSYSNTTAGQIHDVRRAVNHKTLVYCAYPEDENPVRNYNAFKTELDNLFYELNRDRIRQHTRDGIVVKIQKVVAKIGTYLKTMKIKVTKQLEYSDYHRQEFLKVYRKAQRTKVTPEIEARLASHYDGAEQRRKRQEELRAERWAKQDARNNKIYAMSFDELAILWSTRGQIDGKEVTLSDFRFKSQSGVVLRIGHDDKVETSMGALVSVDKAKLLLSAILQGRDIKGQDIDGYKVIGMNGVLTIGCHKITRKEINRFALQEGWITEDQKLPEDH